MFFPSFGIFLHPVIKLPTVGNKAAAQAAAEVTLINSLLFNGVLFVAVKIRIILEIMFLWIVLGVPPSELEEEPEPKDTSQLSLFDE